MPFTLRTYGVSATYARRAHYPRTAYMQFTDGVRAQQAFKIYPCLSGIKRLRHKGAVTKFQPPCLYAAIA